MDDPIGIADGLSDLYRKYLNSALPLRDERLMQERQRLLTEPGALCQEPLLEPIPRYKETLTLSEAVTQLGLHPDLSAFAARGLFPANRRLYRHQVEALDAVLKQQRHLVVTTGTGSGKTECFLLPIIAALLQESATWPRTERPRAVRALLLYPLNALAEDQMMRLRRAVDSVDMETTTGARAWLDQYRQGHRFFFGRYTGHTPISGPKLLSNGKLNATAQARLREEKQKLQRQLACLHEQPQLRYHFPSLDTDTAECWDRWSMQEQPPDILVTNYSMLNIMLMRRVESPIFEQTRAWLAGDSRRVFHLVVDELHTYRGTAGTEVAYLLRLLLHRLGHTPDSPQVRFLASSASLADNAASRQYLQEFFGVSPNPSRPARFTVLAGTPPPPIDLGPAPLRNHVDAFTAFRSEWYTDAAPEAQKLAVHKLAQRLGVDGPSDSTPPVALHEALRQAKVPQAVLSQRSAAPETPEQLATRLFDNGSARAAVAGLLYALALAREGEQPEAPAPLPLREHLFFRNVLGLWACADPQCPDVAVDDRDRNDHESRMLGKLYWTPRLVCTCGARVMDVVICRTCGEVYYGGYRGKGADHADYMVHDQPALETIPGRPVSIYEKKYDAYAVFWPEKAQCPVDKEWTDREGGGQGQEISVSKGWRKAVLDPGTGRLEMTQRQHTGWLYHIDTSQHAGPYNAFPGKCARCDADWRRGRFTPLGPHATGVQKVNQVLADGLMRQITV
ncbi:MAG: DEAD/DEAH box helicase, partial [Candidatus Tectomicrobia bacterium]|nr:DEAD/DEAH box helicase [Candidatus Tectomicrobia bacterium]